MTRLNEELKRVNLLPVKNHYWEVTDTAERGLPTDAVV